MYDFHIHSDFSIDSKYSMEDMVTEAINKNMKSICFTDHVEFEVTEKKLDLAFNTKDYFRKINQVKYKYMNKIEILCGVELGMKPHLYKKYNEFISQNPFDFVLMSMHSIEGKDMYLDNYLKDIKPIEGLVKYYESLYECVLNYNNYDVLGHIDVVDRYFPENTQLPPPKEYMYLIEDILKLVIKNGKGIELNTSGMRYHLKYFHPKTELLKLYKSLGGEIITMGSDAHEPAFLNYKYKEGEKLLKELGFKYIFLFKERKKFPIHIS